MFLRQLNLEIYLEKEENDMNKEIINFGNTKEIFPFTKEIVRV